MSVPKRRRACGNVPPRVAFPTLPSLPALPEHVDPDAPLASLDQKRYLRHVGRDGCVDVDLATYYLGLKPRWAKCPVASEGWAAPVCGLVPGPHREAASWSPGWLARR